MIRKEISALWQNTTLGKSPRRDLARLVFLFLFGIVLWIVLIHGSAFLTGTTIFAFSDAPPIMWVLIPLVGFGISLVLLATHAFSWLYFGFCVVLYLGFKKLTGDTRLAVLLLCIAAVCLWVSLFVSYSPMPIVVDTWSDTVARGGFPISAFSYPVPPLGSGMPPLSSWPLFAANMIFWSVVSVIFVRFFKRIPPRFHAFFYIAGCLSTLCGFLYLLLLFD